MDDDSGEGTIQAEKIVKELQAEGYPIRIHVRRKHEGRGLSSAVLLGFEKAKYGTMLCMDADLQHLPEEVPKVAAPVLDGTAEFTIGSRNVEGGSVEGWTLHRKLISAVATLLALPLTSCTDPMSGFFCLTHEVLERGKKDLNPVGFKIALEIMVMCNAKVQDVGITFGDRLAGESKLDMKTNILYIQQLLHLYKHKYTALVVLVPVVLGLLALWVLSLLLF